MTATLSVVVTNYNHRHYLEETLGSIVSQSVPADEVIVVDDASTDDSLQIIDGFAQRFPRMKVVPMPVNQGPLAATNRGLALARGDWVGLFNADNPVLPGLFHAVQTVLRVGADVGVIGSETIVRPVDGSPEIPYRFDLSKTAFDRNGTAVLTPSQVAQVYRSFYLWIATSGAFLRRDLVVELGGMRSDLDWLSDWFAVHALALRHGAALIGRPGSVMREDAESYGHRLSRGGRKRDQALDALLDTLNSEFKDMRDAAKKQPVLLLSPLGMPLLKRLLARPKDWDLLASLSLLRAKWAVGRLIGR